MPDHDRTPVLVAGARTPIGKFGGALAGIPSVDLGAAAIAAAVAQAGGLVPDRVLLGNVVQAGNGQNPARVAAFRAGLPDTVPAITLNDVCLASMTAAALAGTLIRAAQLDTAVVGGFDSMSRSLHGVQVRAAGKIGDGQLIDLLLRDGLWCAIADQGMGELSERANTSLGIDRDCQDAIAAASHQRADRATMAGHLAEEIVPLPGVDLTADEGIRPSTTPEVLAQLRPAFAPDGTITAGNSSQMSDAGAAGVITSLGYARANGLTPIVEIIDAAVIAGPDTTLHTKPSGAARTLLHRHGIRPDDIAYWEINEAFAGVVVASTRELDIDPDLVNVGGGAIAVGHPLGASGFRLLHTLALQLKRTGTELGVAAICGGGGQGQAVLLRVL